MEPLIYEVYALRYATHAERQASENFIAHDDRHSGPMPLAFYLWAIKGPGRTLVVDTGFDENMAHKRGRIFLHNPAHLLADIGIAPSDVTDVIITHMHYDHCGNLGLFPNARYHIQEAEMAYCTGRAMTYALLRRPFEADNIKEAIDCLFQDRLVIHEGDSDLGGGIRLHKVGGHTKGLQVVSVPTRRGQLVLASDAAHYWANLNRRSPFPIVVDVQEMLAAYDTLERLADGPYHVIPGHDPKVLELFPHVAHNPDIAMLHASPVTGQSSRQTITENGTEHESTSRIAIIGMGPRGISLLEHLLKQVDGGHLPRQIEVLMIDPGPCGEGSHPSVQYEDLLVNTVASQVSIFANDSLIGGRPGPSLTEWARQAGYRRFGDRYRLAQHGEGEAISDHDYLPRSVLGRYLGWAFAQISQSLPANVRIRHVKQRVSDVAERPNNTFSLFLDDGTELTADYVVLATGHGTRAPTEYDFQRDIFARRAATRNPHAAYFLSPYPTDRLEPIGNQACVAIQGMGLTAYDVISSLTTARGGSFSENGHHRIYKPSGQEPKILLFSRNCLPFAARGTNQKGLAGSHAASFFTRDAVEALRATALVERGNPQLDFEHEVLPLIKTEMAYAYRMAQSGTGVGGRGFVPTTEESEAIDRLLDPLSFHDFTSFEQFNDFFLRHVEEDLQHAYLGNLTSPLKAATDVLRDTRDALRAAVEFGGLTPDSHRLFVETFVATTNRIAFGPPKQRNAELLALMDAGVLSLAGGPGNEVLTDQERNQFCIVNRFGEATTKHYADVLICARLDPYSPLTDSSALSRNLLNRGIARPHMNGNYHPGGLDINPGLQVINSKGRAHKRFWALGIPVEGPHFYTHALPRPLKQSRFCQDAEQCATQLLAAISADCAGALVLTSPEGAESEWSQPEPQARAVEITAVASA